MNLSMCSLLLSCLVVRSFEVLLWLGWGAPGSWVMIVRYVGTKSTQDFGWSVPLKIENIVPQYVFSCVLTCHSPDSVDFHTDE